MVSYVSVEGEASWVGLSAIPGSNGLDSLFLEGYSGFRVSATKERLRS